MDSAYLVSRVNNLQRELLQISEHYREYFTKENHSADERAQHEEQVERVNKIREELLAVVEKRAA
jgi:septum formation topological specificity factor MinE